MSSNSQAGVKKVQFDSVRITRHKSMPFQISSFRDLNGRVVRFKQIPLLRENGEEDYFFDANDRKVVKTWDEIVDFSSRRTLILDPVIHKNVITAIRCLEATVTSQKPEGYKPVSKGWILEYEPDVAIEKQYDSTTAGIAAMTLLGKVLNADEMTYAYVSMAIGVAPMRDKDGLMNRKATLGKMAEFVQADPKKFMSIFIDFDNLILKNAIYDETTCRLAARFGILYTKSGFIHFDDEPVGKTYVDIAQKSLTVLQDIKAKLDFMIFSNVKKKESKPADENGPFVSTSSQKVDTTFEDADEAALSGKTTAFASNNPGNLVEPGDDGLKNPDPTAFAAIPPVKNYFAEDDTKQETADAKATADTKDKKKEETVKKELSPSDKLKAKLAAEKPKTRT
jgi:hypothetical protein